MMKPKYFSILLAVLFGSVLLAPASADSRWSENNSKDKRYQERKEEGKSRGKDRQKKQYKQQQQQQQKKSQSKNKFLNPGQGKKTDRKQRQVEQQDKYADRRYRTKRHYDRGDTRQIQRDHYYRDYGKDRHRDYRHDYRDNRWHNRRYELRRGNRLLLLTPRYRSYRNVYIVRPFGHSYFGYGHFHNDNNAWRWLTFTAIALKLLDMVDEQAQREHEAAQIEATTAEVGERIYWDTDDASGYVVTTREGTSSRGLQCREYQHSITVGGETEEAYGTACLQPDGSWKVVN